MAELIEDAGCISLYVQRTSPRCNTLSVAAVYTRRTQFDDFSLMDFRFGLGSLGLVGPSDFGSFCAKYVIGPWAKAHVKELGIRSYFGPRWIVDMGFILGPS